MEHPGPSPTRPVWLPEPAGLGLPPLAGDLEVDVVVLGGGLSGVLCVHELLARGVPAARIALLEARGVGGRASGRNAGFLLADLPEPYERLRASLGEKAARLRACSLRNQQRLVAAAEATGTDAAIELGGVLVAAASAHEEEELQSSAGMLLGDGFAVEFLDAAALSRRLGAANAWGGLADPAGGGIDPGAFVAGVARAAARAGVRMHEHSPATALHLASDGAAVDTAAGSVRAQVAVLAMNAWAGGVDDFLAQAVRPVRAQMLSFPATDRVLTEVVYRNHGFEYFRQDRDGRFHFGGFRQTAIDEEVGTEERLHTGIQQRLLDYARGLYPALEALEPAQRWAGIMGFSQDALPLVGPHPGRPSLLLCCGFTGHGLGFAAEAAHIVAGLVVDGRAADAELFRPDRLLVDR